MCKACRSSSICFAYVQPSFSSSKPKNARSGFWRVCRWLPACLTGKLKADQRSLQTIIERSTVTVKSFDRGETFSGVDYETGLQAVDELKAICPTGVSMVQFALRWILMFDAVTCAIPGAKRPSQAEQNFSATDFPRFRMKPWNLCRRFIIATFALKYMIAGSRR